MSYDVNKLAKLGHLKSLANKIKSDYATKAELAAIKVPEYSDRLPVHLLSDQGWCPGGRED
jgi:hypothetical protein